MTKGTPYRESFVYVISMGTSKSPRNRATNDLDLKKWREYEDLITDSLWVINERDRSGAHSNHYHGNFIPQIPNQLIRRFSRAGDVVLDGFLGSGTTLIETQRLGRNGLGIELSSEIAIMAEDLIRSERTPDSETEQKIIVGDSRDTDLLPQIFDFCTSVGEAGASLILLHPPYDDIIRFSENMADLSNMGTTPAFIQAFGDVVENLEKSLNPSGHLALVIGDKYSKSEWIPLGFYLMAETLKRAPHLKLKSTIVKNMAGNRAKLNQERLWRYRSLSGGFYVFKHEYIFLFGKSR